METETMMKELASQADKLKKKLRRKTTKRVRVSFVAEEHKKKKLRCNNCGKGLKENDRKYRMQQMMNGKWKTTFCLCGKCWEDW